MQDNFYNGDGKRVLKSVGGEETRYYYQEGSVLRTTDDDGNATSFNLLNVSDIFATSRENTLGDEYYFYTEDIRGSKVNIVDSDAAQVASYWYTDFGEVTEVKNTSYDDFENEIQYTGATYDKLTRLLYLNARYYDPSNGRFITQDSYRGERTKPDTWHLYLYCANDPINYVDPTGHASWKVPTGLVGYVIDVIAASLGVGASFSIVKVIFNRAKSNKKFYNEALQMVMDFLVVFEKKVNNAGKKINKFLNRYVGSVGNAIFKIGTNLINYRIDKIQSKLLSGIIKTLPYITSIGSFVAGLIDYSIHNKKLKGYLWTINGLKSWQVKVLNKLF